MPRPRAATAVTFTILAALVAWTWLRSNSAGEGVVLLLDGGRAWGVGSVEGQILLTATDIKFGPHRAWSAETFSVPLNEINALRAVLLDDGKGGTRGRWNFAAHAGQTERLGTGKSWAGTLGLPHWLLITLLLIPPALYLKTRLARRNQIRAGRCATCGYDLRASADKPCPECGSQEHLAPAANAPTP